MEEKQPVVIQGRTINRERSKERLERTYGRSSYNRRARLYSLDDYDESNLANTGNIEAKSSLKGPLGRTDRNYGYGAVSLTKLREGASAYRGGVNRPRVRPRTRQSSSFYSRRQSTDDGLPMNSLMTKIAISVLIVLVILLLNTIKLPFTQAVVDQVRTAITYEFDLDDTLGKLKFVGQSIPKEIRAVFGQDTDEDDPENITVNFNAPVQGEVIQAFQGQVAHGANGSIFQSQGIDIITNENAPVFSAADGVVAAIEQHETYGTSIWVEHGNQVFSFYGRCGNILVKVGQSVRQGDEMGTVVVSDDTGKPVLHFQIWIDDKPVDPLDYIRNANHTSQQRGV